jgi:hypothetical protein
MIRRFFDEPSAVEWCSVLINAVRARNSYSGRITVRRKLYVSYYVISK